MDSKYKNFKYFSCWKLITLLFLGTVFWILDQSIVLASTDYCNLKDQVTALLQSEDHETELSRQALSDFLSNHWFKIKKVNESTVFLALGNSFQKEGDGSWSLKRKQQVLNLIATLIHQGNRIAYDSDSPILDALIQEAVPSRYRFGIGTRRTDSKSYRGITIQNPWIRLKLLLSIPKIIVSVDSIIGAALTLEGIPKNKDQQFFSEESMREMHFDRLHLWATALEQGESSDILFRSFTRPLWREPFQNLIKRGKIYDFKIRYPSAFLPIVYEATSSLLSVKESIELMDARYFPVWHLASFVETLSGDVLRDGLVFTEDYINHQSNAETDIQKKIKIQDGVVLFGSAIGHELYEPLVKEVVQILTLRGFPVSTGGCGGYMEVANRVAFENGVPSIGIPKKEQGDTPSEKESIARFHTNTVSVANYEERIPILLNQGKELVVVAPGGPGTLREFATALFFYADLNQKMPNIILLDKDYYGGLVGWLKNLSFPQRFLKNIKLIHFASQLDEIYKMNDVD